MDADLEEARRAEPPWDPLRERRVLARIDAARVRRAHVRRAVGRWAVAGAAAAAAAIALVWLIPWTDAPTHARVQEPAAAPSVADGGRLTLVDGSEVELEPDARVEVLSQTDDEVAIAHHAGEARYVVSHRPERAFVVHAADVAVHVRGTRFVVRRSPEMIEVEVEQGRVEVTRGETSSLLSAGDAIRMRLEEPPAPDEPETHAEPEPAPARAEAPPRAIPSMDRLLADADVARRAGRLDDAARALRTAVASHRNDPRAFTALFTLARVERRRGREAAAAEAFERAYSRDPNAILAEDALAEAAVSWAACGRPERARGAATRYLQRFPAGEYVERVRTFVE